MSLQVLGQTFLHFDISIAQILIAVTTCAVIELLVTLRRHQMIAWPASALLTGNGVAFVLRVPGTRHGDWWSLRGGWIFAAVGAVSLLSKYLIRVDGRPLFNPSNFGLVLCFLVLGSRRVDPLDFWWVRPGFALAVALTVIIAGGLVLAWRVKMLGLVASFWLTYAAALGVLALRRHCITARWHIGPVCNGYFWTVLVTSPEVLVFMFFMITDPKTVPRGRTARNAYGAAIALVFVALAAPQQTEFATKVALLGGLALVCAARPLLERLLPATAAKGGRLATFVGLRPTAEQGPAFRSYITHRVRAFAVFGGIALAYAALVVGAGAPARSSRVRSPQSSRAVSCADRGTASTPQTRPRVAAVPLPTVGVRDAIDVATPISIQVASQIVRDVTGDLIIAADATEHRDPGMAIEVARFPWLDDLITTICATSEPRTVLTYHVTDAIVTVAKRAAGQVFPEIDVELRGDVRETRITRSTPSRELSERTTPYHDTLVVTKAGGYWLICGSRSDPRTAVCVTAT